jgi:uncharacterized protein involved in exopolysaccharide biosynthesis
MKTLRTESRLDYSLVGTPNHQELQTGAILRIADATEKMAVNHVNLQNERDRFKRYWNEERVANERLRKQVSSLKGQITKLRKRLPCP